MEVRETYYEVYFDGQLEHQGNLEECTELALHALDDDCAEVYQIVVSEIKL
tara:strand:- start:376 stop:528 length:153 start_codon:yes stop_codon:yes gene_type:complete